LAARLATAAVAIPLLLAIIFLAPPYALSLLILTLGTIALVEYMGMAFPEKESERWIGVIAAFAVLGSAVAPATPAPLGVAGLAAALAAVLASVVLRPVDLRDGVVDAAVTMLGVLYVGVLAHFVWLHHLGDGPLWVAFLVANGMASDTGAYFAGRSLGRHKLLPRVSPAKTVEGALGAIVASVLLSLAAKVVLFPAEKWISMVILGVVLAAVGQLGDLCESAMKRAFSAKESGWIFPGHGGVLDRIDSLLFPVAILYYYRAAF